jgi:hypothetical protein
MPGDWGERKRSGRLPGEPELVPHFPVQALSRVQVVRHADGTFGEKPVACPHKRRYRRGSRLVCMVCHASGMDHLGVMARSAATDPKPEQAPEPATPPELTRKEKRALQRDYKIREKELSPVERDYLRGLGVDL